MKGQFIAILLLSLIIVLLPIHLRLSSNNKTLAGVETYYYAMAAEKQEINSPYNALLAGAYIILGKTAFKVLPVVFALAGVILFWLLLGRIKIQKSLKKWILLAYVLSSPVITAATLLTPDAFTLVLQLGGLLLIRKNLLLGALALVTSALSGTEYGIAAIIFLMLSHSIERLELKRLASVIIPILVVFAIGYVPQTMNTASWQQISDFGAVYGYSIFALLLAIIGIIMTWGNKKQYYWTYAITGASFMTGLFFGKLILLNNIVISGLTGAALSGISKRRWKIKFLRQACLLVLFCSLLFSSITHSINLARIEPKQEIFDALAKIEKEKVLTHTNYGFWVEATGNKPVATPFMKDEEVEWDIASMFESTELEKTMNLLEKYNVTHVLITSEMEQGLVWKREGEGLAFLAENSERFKRIETGSEIKLWSLK